MCEREGHIPRWTPLNDVPLCEEDKRDSSERCDEGTIPSLAQSNEIKMKIKKTLFFLS